MFDDNLKNYDEDEARVEEGEGDKYGNKDEDNN